MKKVIFQFSVLVILFFSAWLLLSNINFVKHIYIEKFGKINEKRIGDLMIENIRRNNTEIISDATKVDLEAIKRRICDSNHINASEIELYLFKDDAINAFTLPGKKMIICTGLIKACDSASELSGVMAHEIGHMQHGHIMRRLVKEMGISIVLSIGGNGNGEMLRRMVKLLSSTAFDRKQESEADAAAVEYLNKAHIDPAGLANLFTRLANEKNDMPKQLEWISTHPNSKERAETILKLKQAGTTYYSSMPNIDWKRLKATAGDKSL